MEKPEIKNYMAAWSDSVSLILLAFAIIVAGIDPHRRVWGRGMVRQVLVTLAVAFNIIFSTARLIYEGILVETGPREFLLASVVYCARWLWLYIGISRSGSRSRKAFQVASHLKYLKTIRLGKSTRNPGLAATTQSNGVWEGLKKFFSGLSIHKRPSMQDTEVQTEQEVENSDGRYGEEELVIRRGVKDLPPGVPYWRGVEESVDTYEVSGNTIHLVRLVERELYSDELKEIGTYEYKRRLDDGIDCLYRKFYNLVMTCDGNGNGKANELQVDYSPFLDEFSGIPPDSPSASRIGATSKTPLGNVARRVAADACYYVVYDNGDLRTKGQVQLINECIERAAMTYLGIDDDRDTPSNRESNV